MMHAIELRDVRKTFGANVAVDDLSLAVPRGAVYGVIGPSGAGKTTCIRMIMSILFPDSGSLSVLGPRLGARGQGPHRLPAGGARRLPQDARRRVPHLPGAAQGREPRGGRGARVRRCSSAWGCEAPSARRATSCRRACCSACSSSAPSLHEPDLLILDEPFSGLDPVSVRLLREQVRRAHARGATILLSTHVMAYAEEMCDHVVMIHEGRKVLDQPMAGLRRQFDPRRLVFEPLDPRADVASIRGHAGRASASRPRGRRLRRHAGGRAPSRASALARIAALVPPARIEIARLRLEDVFVRIVAGGGGLDEAAAALRSRLQAGAAEEARA